MNDAFLTCPHCGYQNRPNANHCSQCGAPVQAMGDHVSDQPPSAAELQKRHVSQCEMIIGFLVPRRCDQPALGRCTQCGRSFCDVHLAMSEHGMICDACKQGLDQPVALPATASVFDETDLITFAVLSTWGDDDDRWDDWSDDDDMFGDLS